VSRPTKPSRFGFGGTLLALFMRVGGGIYTKAADVGADLVGKIEKNIPRTTRATPPPSPTTSATTWATAPVWPPIFFESYEVTIVAAMILGLATFGHKGVIFPLLVRGIGVLGSIHLTYTVKAGPNDTSDTALKSVHNASGSAPSFPSPASSSSAGTTMKFDAAYLAKNATAAAGFPNGDPTQLPIWATFGIAHADIAPGDHLLHRRRPRHRAQQGHQLCTRTPRTPR